MLDNTGGGGKTNNVRQYRGRGKTNTVRQYRGRGKEKTMLDNTGGEDKQC